MHVLPSNALQGRKKTPEIERTSRDRDCEARMTERETETTGEVLLTNSTARRHASRKELTLFSKPSHSSLPPASPTHSLAPLHGSLQNRGDRKPAALHSLFRLLQDCCPRQLHNLAALPSWGRLHGCVYAAAVHHHNRLAQPLGGFSR